MSSLRSRPGALAIFVAFIALCAGGAACIAPTDDSGSQEQLGTEEPYFVDDDTLRVDLPHDPSGGLDFDFCMNPGADLNLKDAAWLAFMAGNEYAHLGYVAPTLSSLGFGNDGAGDLLWVKCAKDLRQVRDFEKAHAAEVAAEFAKGPASFLEYLSFYDSEGAYDERWGTCAASWFETSGYDGKRYPAAAFEEYLIQTPKDSQYIQFFSGGSFEIEGQSFKKGSTQVMFARHGTKPIAIISFRGTEPDQWQDLVTDADAWKTSLSDQGFSSQWGKVHRGFWNGFASVADARLMKKIDQLRGTGVKIWITGHSLGGALATILGARMLRDIEAGADLDLMGVYTFGSPRVGNDTFQAKYEAAAEAQGVRLVRFRNGKDAVTTIPKFFFYTHVGTVTYLDESQLTYGQEPGYGASVSLADHSINGFGEKWSPVSGYYRRIAKFMKDPRYSAFQSCNDPK